MWTLDAGLTMKNAVKVGGCSASSELEHAWKSNNVRCCQTVFFHIDDTAAVSFC